MSTFENCKNDKFVSIFLNYCKNSNVSSYYPAYFNYDFKINNPEKLHKELFEKGYLKINNNKVSVSKTGKELLKANADYIKLYKKKKWYKISFNDYEKAKLSLGDNYSFVDVAYSVLNNEKLQFQLKRNFSNARDKVYETALLFYTEKYTMIHLFICQYLSLLLT